MQLENGKGIIIGGLIQEKDELNQSKVPFFGFALLLFFLYCYPIARLTIRLERKFAVKL